MDLLYVVMFFILGSVMASFLTVVGIRLPRGENFISGRSHCDACNKTLRWYELIPLMSYIIQFGKCRNCNKKIGLRYFLYELFTGLLFSISYKIFGFSIDLIISLALISVLVVVIASDIEYMVIPDEILVIASIIFLILSTIKGGFIELGLSIFSGIVAFLIMYTLKVFGDTLFKKESLGGGDIKLMGVLGIIFNYQAIVTNIFVASFIALPYALYITISKKDGLIPFGPFLSISAIIIFLLKLNQLDILDIIYNLI